MFGETRTHAKTTCAVCESAEGVNGAGDPAGAASPDAVTLAVGATAVPPAVDRSDIINTCCGHDLAAAHTVGPFLKYWGLELENEDDRTSPNVMRFRDPHINVDGRVSVDPRTAVSNSEAVAESQPRVWVGSVLMVTRAAAEEVVVTIQDEQGAAISDPLTGMVIDEFKGWSSVRFLMRLPVNEQETKVFYSVTVSGQQVKPKEGGEFHFYIAGNKQPAHWGYYSCSGYSIEVPAEKREGFWGGMKPLWNDVKRVHNEKPMHLLVGGGDQLYNDDVWNCPALKPYLELPRKTEQERDAKMGAAYSEDMYNEVNSYYFHHYAAHFSQDVIGDLYACIPQVMSWDDHDIFDGYGSYPEYLQSSKVFKGIFDAANRWYCVFQQHCSRKDKPEVSVYEVGGRTAVVTCDQRHRRMRDQILPLEHYMRITMLCTNLPANVKHVVFVFTVPVIYPHIRGGQKVLRCVSSDLFLGCLAKIGVQPMNHFMEPELMDDLDDHWSSRSHQEERRFLIEHLQMLARYRGCRVTLLSGDVHVCGAGHLYSHPEPPVGDKGLLHDYRYMPQIVSSAIANPPPPSGLMKVLEYFSRPAHINKHTKHRMDRIIKNKAGLGKPLENKRNWCEVLEQPTDDPAHSGHLIFRLRVETEPGSSTALPAQYDYPVPPLEPTTRGKDDYFDPRSVKVTQRCCGAPF